jgi:hypothetical protein
MKDISFESSSFPVLGIDNKSDKVKGIGTCTLTRLEDDRLFLINSAHTLDIWGNNSPIFIALPNGKTVELPFALKTKSKNIDKVDIAATPLLGEFATHFYDEKISSFPLYDDFPIESFNIFLKRVVFFGFPSSSSRFSIDLKTNQIKAKPICITSIEIEDLTERTVNFYNIDFSLHILAKFERRNLKDQNGIIKKSPDPHGMSGGAVFFAYVEEGQSQDILKGINFVGIGNEYLQNRSLLKATRKDAILSFIKVNFHCIR